MKIRKAETRDIKKCLELQKLDKEDYWKTLDFVNALKSSFVIFIIAEENNELKGYIIGFMCPTKKTDAMIHETRVNRKERGKGIGKALVDEFCKEAFNRGVKDIYALIEPELSNFYIKSCGFKKSHCWIEAKKSR